MRYGHECYGAGQPGSIREPLPGHYRHFCQPPAPRTRTRGLQHSAPPPPPSTLSPPILAADPTACRRVPPAQFEIEFECIAPIPDDIEWKLTCGAASLHPCTPVPLASLHTLASLASLHTLAVLHTLASLASLHTLHTLPSARHHASTTIHTVSEPPAWPTCPNPALTRALTLP